MSDHITSTSSDESSSNPELAPCSVPTDVSTAVVPDPLSAPDSTCPEVQGLFGLADALLRAPELVAPQLYRDRRKLMLLVGLVLAAVIATGLVVASFAGGWQYLAVPLKLSSIVVVGPLLCLPSLYIFACLSESRYDFYAVAIALGQGLGVMALLLCGLMPVAWVFSQSTYSVTFMGALYVVLFAISSLFGLSVTRRLLTQGTKPIQLLWLWQVLFLVVVLQLTTSLRPIVGSYAGAFPKEKLFFLAHWFFGAKG